MSELTLEQVPIGKLRTYHRNPRHGDVTKIAESLKVNGQYRAICVNRGTHTGRANEVLAGNHTLMAARDLAWEVVACTFVDVDDDQAARIVAVDNRTADLGHTDDRLLLELLADLEDPTVGTGYAEDELAGIEALVNSEAWNQEQHDGLGGDDDPDDSAMWPKIAMTVAPDIFEAWRDMLDSYEAANDTAKLAIHLCESGHLE